MDIVERLRAADENSRQRIIGSRIFGEAADEIEVLRTLAKDAYVAWEHDRDAKVGKLLRAIMDDEFRAMYRPDLAVPNA